ncbi:MAG: hypothetical protein GIW94_11380 [Candidatus Eremiobacteraeota bacterium]|nr:hypothetical protein [Candidatus Eremiobacteraeota bacterium]MBC5820973.1 hypothetical protein [Candidatus Eremiobacteraeota bacterium]
MLEIGIRTELGPRLRTYATLLPLGLGDLDATIAHEAADNPWLELVNRPLSGLGGDELRTIAAPGPSLLDHLEAQLAASGVRGAVLRAARYVSEALDEHAYLRDDIATVARCADATQAQASQAVALVQRCEPTGVAARSLGERFRLQLDEAGERGSLAFALTFELDALAAEGSASFASARELAFDELARALRRLRACDPDPARDFARTVDRVFPEIVIERDGDSLISSIDGRFWPDVRLASLEVTRDLSQPMRTARSRARLIVEALTRRKTTLERLAVALLDRQRNYFISGGDPRELLPLSGRELAREVGCAESTISRAITARYAATPFGTISVRSLIARRPGAVGVTTAAVRHRVSELIQSFPQSSDEVIARALRLSGIRLARRTVAKYRHELGLASSRERGRT